MITYKGFVKKHGVKEGAKMWNAHKMKKGKQPTKVEKVKKVKKVKKMKMNNEANTLEAQEQMDAAKGKPSCPLRIVEDFLK